MKIAFVVCMFVSACLAVQQYQVIITAATNPQECLKQLQQQSGSVHNPTVSSVKVIFTVDDGELIQISSCSFNDSFIWVPLSAPIAMNMVFEYQADAKSCESDWSALHEIGVTYTEHCHLQDNNYSNIFVTKVCNSNSKPAIVKTKTGLSPPAFFITAEPAKL